MFHDAAIGHEEVIISQNVICRDMDEEVPEAGNRRPPLGLGLLKFVDRDGVQAKDVDTRPDHIIVDPIEGMTIPPLRDESGSKCRWEWEGIIPDLEPRVGLGLTRVWNGLIESSA